MCRWLAWFGQPVLIEEPLFKTEHGIVDQTVAPSVPGPSPATLP
jgi:hypothetical protein